MWIYQKNAEKLTIIVSDNPMDISITKCVVIHRIHIATPKSKESTNAKQEMHSILPQSVDNFR